MGEFLFVVFLIEDLKIGMAVDASQVLTLSPPPQLWRAYIGG
jgi:hypothetical protein